ncbi:hypothetical protein RA307_09925 [Xanthobacteraceae bacterium Astr-EGSB]|uniref:hypothetical protein n=1 Tax=Astrobacterium formosum TaxID=3069710 RepID=UPI0027B77AAC|nr:hypothetical protein [Xanthobacteraceae bacterium Astr-EGSB]
MNTALARGAGAVMAARIEPADSLDFFATPPWATRSLFECVFKPVLKIDRVHIAADPCCGEGHMAAVTAEYVSELMPVIASDIFDYGYGRKRPADFLDDTMPPVIADPDWYIINPPFRDAAAFVRLALRRARVGVAALCRSQWFEGAERYTSLFRPYPPTLIAPFVERVPMVKGRYDPDASTATSYTWFVWLAGECASCTHVHLIPPGQRRLLTRADDRARFAAWSLNPAAPEAIEEIARALCATAGKDAEGIVKVRRYFTMPYLAARAAKSGDRNDMIEVPAWRARIRAADDAHAHTLTVQAIGRACREPT